MAVNSRIIFVRDRQRHAAIKPFGQMKGDRPAADLAVLNIAFLIDVARVDKNCLIFTTIRAVDAVFVE